ncbi:substrate-binding domain-containing protein [Luteolibacter ambystomatis]|uniref:Substrate-binding domain-containing protein n=1 Tax=Luteolibacter ambystomatis TaxID=2824561 RepID=A0A975G884_9BACT|nr:substrate-binding domain-containing protein [Luteolibacter ambystomatis]QUE50617.1 substrate-binding domain-containing protein [Luteolibacter ambystomatis]
MAKVGNVSVIKRVGAVEAAATALREMVAAGKWADRLPGTRVLAGQLGVSQPTVQLALLELAKDGVLESAGERKAYRVKSRGASLSKESGPKGKRVILLTHQAIERTAESGRQVMEMLHRMLTPAGWQVDYRIVDFLHARTPHRSWDDLIGAEPGEQVVALFGRPALAEWAVKRGVKIIFLGGVTDGFEVPVVAVRSANLLAEAYRRLIALGHRRIVTQLCDRPQSYIDSMREAARMELEAAGLPYSPAYHTPDSEYLRPDVSWSIMESLFKRERPTALVLLDWRELVTAICFLSKIGLKVPEDVSVVLLNDQANAEWFQPPLARFKFPIARMARRLKAWLEGKWDPDGLRVGVAAEWVPGESIAPPPKG